MDVVLDPATLEDAPLLENLLQLYIHDLSAVFTIELGLDGRFTYDKLPLYWIETTRRFAFLVRYRGAVVGFVFITRGSPASEDPEVFDVAEFFVLRRYRRSGVGRAVESTRPGSPNNWRVFTFESRSAIGN